MERAQKVKQNMIVTLLTQILLVVFGFAVRKIFIATLGVSYLGYNSVFTNILQMLNLADLGIGVAITSFLYKPLAEGNAERIKALMTLYKKIYNVMGLIVLCVGLVVSIFIGYLIPDSNIDLWSLRLLFYINLGGTVATYFLAYKRTLIIADQKSYVTNIVDTAVYFFISIAQIGCLVLYPSYIIYLVLNVAKAIISNIILSVRCNKIYGSIDKRANQALINEYRPLIRQYVKDVFISRIGAVVYYGTDNVIISSLRGSLLAGFLSNYTLITGYLTTIITQLLASLQATFGNYISSNKTQEEQKQMTDNYLCANYMVGNFCMICFVFLVQPFVSRYFGQALLLPFSTATWLGINLMLSILIQLPSQVFTIYKLFRYDRLIIIISAALNILISVVLVKQIGVDGALIGTFITSLIYLFSRFYIIASKLYNVSYWSYVLSIVKYLGVSAITAGIVYFACNKMVVGSWIDFIVRGVFVSIITVAVPSAILSVTKEFKFLIKTIVPGKFRSLFRPFILYCISICIISTAVLIEGGYFGS